MYIHAYIYINKYIYIYIFIIIINLQKNLPQQPPEPLNPGICQA